MSRLLEKSMSLLLDKMAGEWKVINSEIVSKNQYFILSSEKVKLPNDIILDDYYKLETFDWVNVIAITHTGEIIIERQYRHAYGKYVYEICSGMVKDGETPMEAAKRELLEETGFSGGEWFPYGISSPDTSLMTNKSYCFLALGVKRVSNPNLEQTEFLEVFPMDLKQVEGLLRTDQIVEGVMQAPLWRYIAEHSMKQINL